MRKNTFSMDRAMKSYERTQNQLISSFLSRVISRKITQTELRQDAFAESLDKQAHIDVLVSDNKGLYGIAVRNRNISSSSRFDVLMRRGSDWSELEVFMTQFSDPFVFKPKYIAHGFYNDSGNLQEALLIDAFEFYKYLIPTLTYIRAFGGNEVFGFKTGPGYNFFYVAVDELIKKGIVLSTLSSLPEREKKEEVQYVNI